jgi:hypothetical protein
MYVLPLCQAEYREGFARCYDCGVDLVAVLPPQAEMDPIAPRSDRPDQAPPVIFLAWFAPMTFFCAFYALMWLRPEVIHNFFFAVFLFTSIFVANIGGFWMLYRAVRHEKRVARYVLLAFGPYRFVWYLLVRYPLRSALPRLR